MSSASAAPGPAESGEAGAPTNPGGGGPESNPGVPISEHAAYLAQIYIAVTAVLLFLCLVAFVTRIYQRIRPVWKAGLDDYFIVAGFVRVPPPFSPLPFIVLFFFISWFRSKTDNANDVEHRNRSLPSPITQC